MSEDSKIITPEKFKRKPTRPDEAGAIDLSNPVMTVYGVQMFLDGVNQGTSLYETQAKQVYVLHTLNREATERRQTWSNLNEECRKNGIPGPAPLKLEEYKAINYPVY